VCLLDVVGKDGLECADYPLVRRDGGQAARSSVPLPAQLIGLDAVVMRARRRVIVEIALKRKRKRFNVFQMQM
jgi:hypothetical protein